jgi:drug/metabolite transporter (DMT)-like permease
VGAVACLPFAGQLVSATGDASASDIGWVIYLGVFPTAIAFTTYAFALQHMTASSLGISTYLVPPLTIVLGWLFLGETPPGMAYVGGALALVGVAVARHKPHARRAEPGMLRV